MPHEITTNGLLYSDDRARLDLDAVHAMLRTAYWCRGIPRETLDRAFANSLTFGVYEGVRQIAVARVISDRATFAYLCDVYVADDRRGLGIGKALVAHILGHPELQGLRRWCLLTKDAHGLYEQFGFGYLAEPRRFMEIARPGMYEAGRG